MASRGGSGGRSAGGRGARCRTRRSSSRSAFCRRRLCRHGTSSGSSNVENPEIEQRAVTRARLPARALQGPDGDHNLKLLIGHMYSIVHCIVQIVLGRVRVGMLLEGSSTLGFALAELPPGMILRY